MQSLKQSRGFTLIEIMIVVAIVGLLAAIAVPNFVNARKASQQNTCINHLRQIDAAKEQYAIEHNMKAGTAVKPIHINPYIKNGYQSLTCPAGGQYQINAIGEDPTCSIGDTHKL